MALLSVIVPIYGVEKYLRQCVDSIVAQTYQDIEIILVDDGSKDSCPEICDEYASEYPSIKVVHKQNGGLLSARKAGLEAATGQYVSFIDGDDYVERDIYEKMSNIIEKTNADIVVFGFQFRYPERTQKWNDDLHRGLYTKVELESKVYPVMMCHDNKLERKVAPSVCNKLLRRELLQKVLPCVPETIRDGEDASITYPCMLLAEKVFFAIDEHAYNYRILDESMSHNYDVNWYKSASNYCEWLDKSIVTSWAYMKKSVSLEKYRMYYRYIYREFERYKSKGVMEYCKRMKEVDDSIVGMSRLDVKVSCLELPTHDKIICSLLNHKNYKMAYQLMKFKWRVVDLVRSY